MPWVCLNCRKQYAKFRLKCANCGGFCQTVSVLNIHDSPTVHEGEPILAKALELHEALTIKEIFALVEIDDSGNADLAFVNIGDGPMGHAETHMCSFLSRLIILGDDRLERRGVKVRCIIKYSPCFHVCTESLCAFRAALNQAGRLDLVLIVDFMEAYLGDRGLHRDGLDRLLDAGIVVPNYMVERAIDEVETSLSRIVRHFRTLTLMRTVTRDEPLLGACISNIQNGLIALRSVEDLIGLMGGSKMSRRAHVMSAIMALQEAEKVIRTLMVSHSALNSAVLERLRVRFAELQRSVRGRIGRILLT